MQNSIEYKNRNSANERGIPNRLRCFFVIVNFSFLLFLYRSVPVFASDGILS